MGSHIKRTMVHTELDQKTGLLRTSVLKQFPDTSAGDLAYLDHSRPHDVQIRPMLDGERPRGSARSFPPGATWLVYISPLGFQLRSLVTMPSPYRKNIASNVARAIRRVARVSPAHAAAFEMAMGGVDPFEGAPGNFGTGS